MRTQDGEELNLDDGTRRFMVQRPTGASRHPRAHSVLWLTLVLGCGESANSPVHPDSMPGKADFAVYCAACHHAEGLGVKGGGPPLASSPWVAGPEARLIRIVLHGVRGPLTVGNVTYNLEMPGFGSILDDAQVAALVSFARRKFGGVHAPTTPRAVRRVRGETRGRTGYWTAEELLDLR